MRGGSKLALGHDALGEHEEALELKRQGLQIARETGNPLHVGLHLTGLGRSYLRYHQLDRAEDCFREAISICDEMDTMSSGSCRSLLALVLARGERFADAFQLLKEGEAQVVVSLFNHGKFLCIKGQVLHLAGDTVGASSALVHARGIARELSLSDKGELSEAIAELAELLG